MSWVDEAPEGHRALQPLRHRGGHQGSHRQGLHYIFRGRGYGVHAIVPRWGPIFYCYCSLYYHDYNKFILLTSERASSLMLVQFDVCSMVV